MKTDELMEKQANDKTEDIIILNTEGLSYEYGDGTKALTKVNIKIPKGKTIGILGGNGAGKSTLFLNMNGIFHPSEGAVFFKGEAVKYDRKSIKELRKSIGIVFQDPDDQLFSASVYQDISFGPLNLGLDKEETIRRVEKAILRTGVSEFRDKPAHNLSFGQKKRVAIAGILAMEPEILVLDEPTAGLDPRGVSDILKLLVETQQESDFSVIISTHDIDIVPLFCDYVYVMDKGEVVIEGTPEEIFSDSEKLRSVNLRLPRIGHLMEILREKDDFDIEGMPTTISEARRALVKWKEENSCLR